MMIKHLLQAALVIFLSGVITVCVLMATARGRSFLAKIRSLISRDPISAVVIFLGIWAFTAYGGSKPEPPPIITQEGIQLLSCDQDPDHISFSWTTADENIHIGTDMFLIQERFPEGWITIGSTKGTNYTHRGFTISKARRYRIAVDITPELEAEQ